MNETTLAALRVVPECVPLAETVVKGRSAPVHAYVIDVSAPTDGRDVPHETGSNREGNRK